MAKAVTDAPSLEEYADRYLACRDLRHAWETRGYFKQGGATKRRLRCLRCKTVRYDAWEGFEVKRQYEYADGYLLDGRVYGADVRDELLRRNKVYADEESMIRALGGINGRRRRPSKPRHENVIDLTDNAQRRATARRRASVGSRSH